MQPVATANPAGRSIPLPPFLDRIIRDGGISAGNPADSPPVVVFRDLLDRGVIQPGDIIIGDDCARPELAVGDNVVPGHFTHCGVYVGKDGQGQPQTCEAWFQGVMTRDAMWWPRSYNSWAILRPQHADGTPATSQERAQVLQFLRGSMGCGYNVNWLARDVALPVEPEKTRFHCAQLAWAAWKYSAGIDVVPRTPESARFLGAIAPELIYQSPNVTHVAERITPTVPISVDVAAFLAAGAGTTAVVASAVPLALAAGPLGAALLVVGGMACATAGAVAGLTVADEIGLALSDPRTAKAWWGGCAFGPPSHEKTTWPAMLGVPAP